MAAGNCKDVDRQVTFKSYAQFCPQDNIKKL